MTNDIVFHKTIGREEERDMEELLKLSSSSSFPSRVYFAKGGEAYHATTGSVLSSRTNSAELLLVSLVSILLSEQSSDPVAVADGCD